MLKNLKLKAVPDFQGHFTNEIASLNLSLTKRRGNSKGGGKEEGERRKSPHPLDVFSCALFFALPPLPERLEQAILVLEDLSVAVRNKDTKTLTVLFTGTELGSLSCLLLLSLTDQTIFSRFTIDVKSSSN